VISLRSGVKFVCPPCKIVLRVPSEVMRDFSPGGKEYHEGGTSSLVCPRCGGLIELK
jgi:predicted RNA-binding Zn-ribbon protein involved in translation (DUF1610 family)